MTRIKYILLICVAVFATACSTTKYLPAGQKLYDGGEVKIADKDSLSKNDVTGLTADLEDLLRPKPNTKILGMRYKLWIYFKTLTNKKRGLKQWLNKKLGEPPVLVSAVDMPNNSNVLKSRLQNKGFFQAQVSGDTVSKKGSRVAKAVYTAQVGPAYHYNKIAFPTDVNDLDTAVAGTAKESLLKVGDRFDLDVIKNERIRIDAKLKEKGFFYFGPDYLIMRYDSTITNHKVDMFVTVKPTTPDQARWIYSVRNIYVYPNYSLRDTAVKLDSAERYRWYSVIDPRKTVRPFMFKNAVLLHPKEVYNRTEHNKSLNRFIELGPFRYVKNRFEDVTPDSPYLDVYYYLTQYKRKSLQAEILGRQSSANFNGTQFNLTYRNKNTFKGGELFQLQFFVSSDIQFGNRSNGFNVYQFGVKPSISWPRFISPWEFKTDGAFIPRTNLNTGYTLINRTSLYNLNSFNASWGYSWKPNLHKQHELNLMEFTYVNAASVSQLYRDSITKTQNPTLKHVIDNQLTFGPSYSYTYTNTTEEYRTNTLFYNGKISTSANVVGLVTGADTLAGKVRTVLGTPFNQYVKLENDLRFYHRLGPKGSKIATRLLVGVGIPYGNSTVMPYSQQFFIGGANSLRGFSARSLGPGGFNPAPSQTSGTQYLADQSGDIRIEANLEYRPKLFSIVEGAIFADAGNIWLMRGNPLQPGAAFGKNFLSQVAADAGVGLRFNLSVLILRTDLAFPIIKPYLPAGQRVVINQIDFRDATWRGQNLIFNLAIGYPF